VNTPRAGNFLVTIMKLTKAAIEALRLPAGSSQSIFWDSETKGFGVKVNPKGTKTFILSYRVNGRKRILKIGRYGTLSLEDARKRAKKALAAAIDGQDLLGSRAVEAKGKTVAHLCDDYIERHAKVHKRTWKNDVQRLTKNIVPHIGARLITSIVPADILRIHHDMTMRGAAYEANRVVEVLRKMFNLARVWGLTTQPNPVIGIVKNHEQKREVYVSHEQMPLLAQAIDEEENVYVKVAIWLLLHTALRKTELLSAKWEYVDWKNKELCLPYTKNGKPHYIPLSDQALDLLRKTPRSLGSEYIFPGDGTEHRKDIKKNWERIRNKIGLPALRIHDLRRTVGSWLVQDGYSLHLVGTILNHQSTETTKRYARFARGNERKALAAHSALLESIARGEPSQDEVMRKVGE
jgi:integrase